MFNPDLHFTDKGMSGLTPKGDEFVTYNWLYNPGFSQRELYNIAVESVLSVSFDTVKTRDRLCDIHAE